MLNIKKIIKSNYFPFIILFIFMLILHLCMNIKTGDYKYFNNILNDYSLSEYLDMRYNTWSSRLIIEILLVGIIKLNPIVWMVVDSLFITITGVLISKLFINKNNLEMNYVIMLLMFMYPLLEMSSAGWIPTTLNYIWPLMCMLLSFMPIRNYLDNKQSKWYIKLLYIVSILFACNQEQVACIVFGVYVLFIVYTIVKKKIDKFSIIMLLLSIASLVFILTCPGNSARHLEEIGKWYPEYANYDLIHELSLGFTSTMSIYATTVNFLIFVLSILVAFYKFKDKNIFNKIISFIPLFIILSLQYMKNVSIELFPTYQKVIDLFSTPNLVYNTTYLNTKLIVTFSISIIFFISLLYSIYVLFKDNYYKKIFIPMIFLIGLASRLIIGFSPTVFASLNRTNLFFCISILIVILLIYQNISNSWKFDKRKYIVFAFLFITILNYSSILCKLLTMK